MACASAAPHFRILRQGFREVVTFTNGKYVRFNPKTWCRHHGNPMFTPHEHVHEADSSPIGWPFFREWKSSGYRLQAECEEHSTRTGDSSQYSKQLFTPRRVL